MNRERKPLWTSLPWIAATALAYALLAKIALGYPSWSGLVTTFWPAAGLALASVLLGGRRFAAGIYVGAFVGMVWTRHPPLQAAILAAGSTLEPILGSWLLVRRKPFDVHLQGKDDFLRLFLPTAALSPAISAAIGIGTLAAFGSIPTAQLGAQFAHWWMGDTLGIVIAAPFFLIWRQPPRLPLERAPEAALLLGLSFFIGQIVFLDWFPGSFGLVNDGYWLFLIISCIAVRLGLHAVLAALLLVVVQALAGAAQGVGFFANDLEKTQLVNFWAYTLGLAAVGISLAVSISQRERAAAALRSSQNLYQSLFANMLDGLAHCRMIFRDSVPVDFEVLSVNPKFEKISGLDHVVGRTFMQFLPDYARDHPDVLASFARVVQTGEPIRWDQYLSSTGRWLSVAAYRPAAGEFIIVVENIDERVRAEQELRKLSIAVEQSPVSIVITDRNGLIEYVNPAFSTVSGYGASEVQGQNPRVLQSGQTARKTYEELWSTLAAGGVWRGDFINRRKDGTHYYETATISALRRPDGTVSHYVGVKQDTTELKRILEDLQSSENRLRLAKTAAGLGVFDTDLLARTHNWDERMRQLWGLGAEECVTDELFLNGLHSADRASAQSCMDRALDPNGTGQYRAEFRVVSRAGGRLRHVATVGQAFFENGRAVRLVGTVQDISEEKRLLREDQERRGEMELLIHQQVAAQTAAAIAHELNQPLVAISAYSEAAVQMLEAQVLNPEKLGHALRGAMEQSQRAGQTLHQLLEFLHQGELPREPVDLNLLIQHAVVLAEESGNFDLKPVLELQSGLPPVLANSLQIEKVLLNLLRNSAEATVNQHGTPVDVLITVRTDEARNMAQVTVRDSGPGLSAGLADRIFEPFFTTKRTGIGLGLAISRALIEAHGGQLWADVDSRPGATFHFVLPFAP